MKFIILLISLLLQRETRRKDFQRDRSWFVTLTNAFELQQASVKKQVAVYLISVVGISCALAILLYFMTGLLWGTVAVILQIALFLYVLGRDDVNQRFMAYRQCWKDEDYQGAYHCAQRDIGIEDDALYAKEPNERNNAALELADESSLVDAYVNDPKSLHKKVCETVIMAWFRRFFVLVFWFVVGGVPLSLMCLLSYWYAQTYKWPWTDHLIKAIEWIPARLLAFTFALAGDFTSKFPLALQQVFDVNAGLDALVVATALPERLLSETAESGFDGQQADAQLHELNQLLYRSAVIWLILIGAFTLFGSLS